MKLHPDDLATLRRLRAPGGELAGWEHAYNPAAREHVWWSPALAGPQVRMVTDDLGGTVVTMTKATGELVTMDSHRGIGFEAVQVLRVCAAIGVVGPAALARPSPRP